MRVKRVGRVISVLPLFWVSSVMAEEALSKAFLEYLVAFETDDGEWIDPQDLEVMAQLGNGEQSASEQREVDTDEN